MRGYLLCLIAACGGGSSSHDTPSPDAPVGSPTDAATHVDAPVSTGGDLADDGPSTVTSATATLTGATSDRKLPATIYTPSPANGAAVIISPGFQLARTQYASFAHHLATYGYTVFLTDYADQGLFADHQKLADDVGAVITYALAQQGITQVALAGHSLGGDISTLTATADTRVKAVLGWDPVDASSPDVVPAKMATFHGALAVIGETTDGSGGFMPCAPTADNFQQFYAAAPSPAMILTAANADHMDWVDDGTCAVCGLCTAGTADATDVHAATRRMNIAWLDEQLLGKPAVQLPGAMRK